MYFLCAPVSRFDAGVSRWHSSPPEVSLKSAAKSYRWNSSHLQTSPRKLAVLLPSHKNPGAYTFYCCPGIAQKQKKCHIASPPQVSIKMQPSHPPRVSLLWHVKRTGYPNSGGSGPYSFNSRRPCQSDGPPLVGPRESLGFDALDSQIHFLWG